MIENAMHIIFRVDSSLQIGSGHLQRCITLAMALQQKKMTITFICRDLPGNGIFLLKKYGFNVDVLTTDSGASDLSANQCQHHAWLGVSQAIDATDTLAAIGAKTVDWMIVDHYALDIRWEQRMRQAVKHLMVIDDLADREHDCDVLLDQNHYLDKEKRYCSLVPSHCLQLLGPDYALLREEFQSAQRMYHKKNNGVERLAVFFGGSDLKGATEKTLAAIQHAKLNHIRIDVLIGALNPNTTAIQALAASMPNVFLYTHMDSIATWLAESDVAIGGGGVTLLERAALGIPSLVLSLASNQEQVAIAAHHSQLIYYLGRDVDVAVTTLANAITTYINDHDRLLKHSATGMQLVDGLGCARVIQHLHHHPVELKERSYHA